MRPSVRHPRASSPPPSGITLIETLVVLLLATILLAVAVPGFGSALARLRLEGAASELAIDLQYARSEAVRRSAAVALTTHADGSGYSVSIGNVALKRVALPSQVTISRNQALGFEPLRGGSDEAALRLSHAAIGQGLQVSAIGMGRVQLCATGGTMRGYASC